MYFHADPLAYFLLKLNKARIQEFFGGIEDES
jgi:hypothetical protein